MPGLGETVAELVAKARPTSSSGPISALTPVPAFGTNPGALGMWLHVPPGLSAKAPLVVVLHGCGQTAAGYAASAGWLELSDRHGFALLCPEQARANNANLCFNWFEDADIRRGSGEAESVAQMVRRAVTDLGLDPRRVFVTGLSAGGAMTAVMLAAYPELFAAGAVIAGLPYGAASGVAQAMGAMRRPPALSAKAWGDKVRAAAPAPARLPRVSIWRGDADTTVAPGAGDALALQWCDVHGATDAAEAHTGLARHGHKTWRAPGGDVVVQLHTIAGLGHGTPIAARGVDGCGSPGPWILEVGVSSSQEMARSWGLTAPRHAVPAFTSQRRPRENGAPPVEAAPSPATAVGGTIARALRSAGLLR